MKGKDKSKKAKVAKAIKKTKYRKKKYNDQKKDEDSDLSDFESEFVEELPEDVSFKVQKLIREANDELRKPEVDGTEFLEKDPLIDLSVAEDGEGFLPESRTVANTAEIWNRLKNLSNSHDPKESKAEKLKPVYKEIGEYLAKYKSGGLPKAFKVLPKMSNWTEMLQLTNPQNWTPNAMHEATRLFASNMNEANAEVFYSCVLLPAVRQNLSASRTLNHHYYEALMRAMFKPTAWFKGILLPMVEEGCTYKEAAIIGSVLRKVSIPTLHVSAFIIKICQNQKWFGSTSFILSILFQKKFKLPPKVVHECLMYFYKFVNFHDHLPVIWHQSLYMFLYNYKHMLDGNGQEMVREIVNKHRHPQIGTTIDKLMSCTIEEIAI